MNTASERLMNDHQRGLISRRSVLLALPGLAMVPRLMAQGGKPQIALRAISHMALFVTDLKRSLEFYQGLFGMPILSRQGPNTVLLQIGSGPQFMALVGGVPNVKPGINHMCFTVPGFNVDG